LVGRTTPSSSGQVVTESHLAITKNQELAADTNDAYITWTIITVFDPPIAV